jgi:hypothetical protein
MNQDLPIRDLSSEEAIKGKSRASQIGSQLKIKDHWRIEPYWDFTVKWGTRKERHGVELIIWANHYVEGNWDEIFGQRKNNMVFQIHGRYDAGLPAGFGFIADQFLP